MLDGYGILDLHADWKVRDVTPRLRLANALNQKHAPLRLYSSFAGDYYFYPAEGRTLFSSVLHDFAESPRFIQLQTSRTLGLAALLPANRRDQGAPRAGGPG